MVYLFVKFGEICFSGFLVIAEREDLTSDLNVALTLGIGTRLLCKTYLLIMLHFSVKFH